MKVKYTSSKWFLENNGEWIEIDEKDWDNVKTLAYKTIDEGFYGLKNFWQPTPDTEYQLYDVWFEIQDKRSYVGLEVGGKNPEAIYVNEKVAHLKVENKDFIPPACTKCNDSGVFNGRPCIYCNKVEDLNQEQSEVEKQASDSEIDYKKSMMYWCDKWEVTSNELEKVKGEVERLREENEKLNSWEKRDIMWLERVRKANYETELKSREIYTLQEQIKELESKLSQLPKE